MPDRTIRTLGVLALLSFTLTADDADARRANNLGAAQFSSGQLDAAAEQFRYAYQHLDQEDSATLAAVLCNLGHVALARERLAEASDHFLRAVEMDRRLLRSAPTPENEGLLAVALANLGELYRRQKMFTDAERTAREALALKLKVYGPDALETAGTRNNLGIVLHDAGKYDEAEPLLRQSLAVREQRAPAVDAGTAAMLGNLAAVSIALHKYAAAATALDRQLAMLEKLHGPTHDSLARVLVLRADLYRAEGRSRAAEKLLLRALRISNSGDIRDRLAAVYRAEGRVTESRKVYERGFNPAPVVQP